MLKLMLSLTKTTMTATTIKIIQNSVAASTQTLSLLQIYAAHAMVVTLCPRENLETSVTNGTKLLKDMLQIVKKDLSVLIQSNM